MKLALCHPYVLPRKGGCETYITDLTRRLMRDGHQVHLYAWDWDQAALPAGIEYHRVRRPRFILRPLRPWLFSAACREALACGDHDLAIGFDKVLGVDLHYPQGGLYRETIRHNALIPPPGFGRWKEFCRRVLDPGYWSFLHLENRQFRQESALVVVNSGMVRRHAEASYALSEQRLHVVHSAIDPARFHATNRLALRHEVRKQWGVEAREPVGLFAATNYPLKGLAPLLHAVQRLDDAVMFKLAIVGSTNIAPYQELTRRLGIEHRVQFIGFCNDMKRCYFAADFLVHPTFYDPCSLVVLEALACGLPVITSRYNGATELYHTPDEGLVIDDPHDHAAVAQALTRMSDATYRAGCARAAQAASQRWTFEMHYQRLLSIVHKVAQRKQAA